MTVAK